MKDTKTVEGGDEPIKIKYEELTDEQLEAKIKEKQDRIVGIVGGASAQN